MPRRPKGEERYYEAVRKWLEARGYYCGGGMYFSGTSKERLYVKAGIAKLKADVIGIRNVGNEFVDNIEILTVEVKDKPRIAFRDIEQAYGYSTFSHKVYLATTAEPSEDDKATASRMGVGLIKIGETNLREILSASLKQPDEATMLRLLNSLWIVRCTICGCYVFKWDTIGDLDGKSYLVCKRARQLDHMRDFGALAKQPSPFGDLQRKELKASYAIKRFICRTCSEELGLRIKTKRRKRAS